MLAFQHLIDPRAYQPARFAGYLKHKFLKKRQSLVQGTNHQIYDLRLQLHRLFTQYNSNPKPSFIKIQDIPRLDIMLFIKGSKPIKPLLNFFSIYSRDLYSCNRFCLDYIKQFQVVLYKVLEPTPRRQIFRQELICLKTPNYYINHSLCYTKSTQV